MFLRLAWRRAPGSLVPSISAYFSKNSYVWLSQSLSDNILGEIAMINYPLWVEPGFSSLHFEVSYESLSPTNGPDNNSTIKANAEPLCPPNGNKTPLTISAALVVSFPEAESLVPSGTSWPSRAAGRVPLSCRFYSHLSSHSFESQRAFPT